MAEIKILVVEDEGLVARDVQNMLKSLGYKVSGVVASGEEALEIVEKEYPDIVLMDIVLKGEIDGITAAEKLWETHGIPIIYLTAYADEQTFERAKLSGPFGYLIKPFEERELQTTIEMALYKSRMEMTLREREQWLSTVLKSINDGIIATDGRGRITFMNPLAEILTGWRQEESFQKPLAAVLATTPEMLEVPGETAAGQSREFLLHPRLGADIPIEQTLAPIIDRKKISRGRVIVFRDITLRKRAERELQESRDRLHRALDGIISAMAATIEMRDPYTAGHQQRVSRISEMIGREMGLPETQIEGLRMAGDIHDIGKIYVPAEILSKPGKLSDIEYTIIKTHVQVGFDILKTIEFPWPIAQIVVQHHERLDGSGYPAGLKDKDILLESRILMVADVFEAMSSHRPYRPSFGVDKALRELEENKGRLYDPAVVETCLRLFKEKGLKFD